MTVVPTGDVVRITKLVSRILAPNPGLMRRSGTNTYIAGTHELAVIDPGPAIDSHIERIAQAVGNRLRWILCTHTHRDHSSAVALLKKLTGAQVLGCPAPPDERHDQTFCPDKVLKDGERIVARDFVLQTIHTPGHSSNHLCFLLEQERLLFTGDHIMQGSTVVISPPDGSMRAYLGSLDRLLGLDLAILAPGHGSLIDEPYDEIRRLIQHRLNREQKVLAAFRAVNPAGLDDLLPLVYEGLSADLLPAARRSLHAHVIKLAKDGLLIERAARLAKGGENSIEWEVAGAGEKPVVQATTIGWTRGMNMVSDIDDEGIREELWS
jgi:glyoxylase-like metal-dependent hydrolase (beta-lactamase superfamily II)